jgi:hypothetical protein
MPLINRSRFSPDEQNRCCEFFAPSLAKYRSRTRLSHAIFVVGITFMFIVFLLPKTYVGWGLGAVLVCWLGLVIIAIMQSKLECPGCGGNIMSRDLENFCSECGAANLKPRGWFTSPHCESCGKTLRRRKTRQYRVRACTHCGLMLDEKGL